MNTSSIRKALGMNSLVALAAMAVLGIATSAPAQQTVSMQFAGLNPWEGSALNSAQTAGVVPASNWNVLGNDFYGIATTPQTFVNSNLTNSAASPSGIGYSITYGGNFTEGNSVASASDNQMLTAEATTANGAAPVSLTINGMQSSHTYNLYVYLSGGPNQLTYGKLALAGGSTYFYQTAEGDGASTGPTTYQNHSSTTDLAPAGGSPITEPYVSNYVEFTGLTSATSEQLTLTQIGGWPFGSFSSTGGSQIGMAGFQLVDNGASAGVPEPTTLSLVGIGSSLLLIRRRRHQ